MTRAEKGLLGHTLSQRLVINRSPSAPTRLTKSGNKKALFNSVFTRGNFMTFPSLQHAGSKNRKAKVKTREWNKGNQRFWPGKEELTNVPMAVP